MKAMKKVLPLMLGAAIALPVSAAPLKIGMSFQELNNPYFVTMKQALEEAAASVGATVVITDARHDVAKQISDVEDMIQKKIDILLLNPTDSTGVEGAVKSAKAAGLVVAAVDANAKGPVDTFVGSKNYDAGVMACEYMGKALDGKGDVAILDGIPVVPILGFSFCFITCISMVFDPEMLPGFIGCMIFIACCYISYYALYHKKA